MEDTKEGHPEVEPTEPEKRDFSDLREHLKSLIERIGGLQKVSITSKSSFADRLSVESIGGRGEGWWSQEIIDTRTKKSKGWMVHVPERIMESSENVAKGSAAHEAGHVAITRHHQYIPDLVMQEPGFHQLISAAEELPTDQVVRDRYPGAGRWVDEVREDQFQQGEAIRKIKKNIGYIPKSIKLGSMIVYGRHIEGSPEAGGIYADIRHVYENIKEALFEVEHILPDEDVDERGVLDKSKERYKIIYKKIWPEVKKLVEEDIETEKLRQMLEQAAKQSEKEKREKEESEKGGEGEGDEAKEGDKEIADALKQMSEDLAAEMDRAIEEALEEKEKGIEVKREESAEEDVPMRPEGEEAGEEHMPIPMDKLSKRLIEALRKAFNKLPKHIQEKLIEMARKAFEEIEDEFVKEYSSELVDGGETHEEFRLRKEQGEVEREKESVRVKAVKATAEEMKDLERREAGLHRTRELYDQVYEEVRELDDTLYRELEEIFTPNIKRKMRLRSVGSKINLPAVFRWESGRKGGAAKPDDRIFESVHLPEKKDYAFTLLNDLSGSMDGEKIEQDFRAKILLAEVLNRLGVRNEILGFQDRVIIFKKFSEELNDDIRKKISGITLEACDKNPGGNNRSNFNDDGPCLLDASKGLAAEYAKEKFLIVISDGMPDGLHSTSEDLTEAVKLILETTNQKLVALGLGEGTEHVKEFYPTSVPNITVKELTGILGGLLEDMIVNPEKYKYTETRE